MTKNKRLNATEKKFLKNFKKPLDKLKISAII